MKQTSYGAGLVLLLVAATLIACSDNSVNPFKFGELRQTPVGQIHHVALRSGFKTASVPFQPGQSYYFAELLLGRYNTYSSSFAIRFANLLMQKDSVAVTKAVLIMRFRYLLPATADSSFSLSVFALTNEWEEISANPQELASQIEPTPLVPDTTVLLDTLRIVHLQLPASYVQDVLFHRKPNAGFLLKSPESGKLVAFDSDETSSGPAIRIFYKNGSKTDSITVSATEGLSLLESTFQQPENRVLIGNEDFYAAFLFFDHTFLPQYATINNAYVTLTLDQKNSVYPENWMMVFSQIPTGTSNWEVNLGEPDSARVDTTHYRGTQTVRLNVTKLLQQWVSGEKENYGLRITPRYLGNELFRLVFFSESAADTALRPRLDVYYTEPANFGR